MLIIAINITTFIQLLYFIVPLRLTNLICIIYVLIFFHPFFIFLFQKPCCPTDPVPLDSLNLTVGQEMKFSYDLGAYVLLTSASDLFYFVLEAVLHCAVHSVTTQTNTRTSPTHTNTQVAPLASYGVWPLSP
jgi:hypothetical protein